MDDSSDSDDDFRLEKVEKRKKDSPEKENVKLKTNTKVKTATSPRKMSAAVDRNPPKKKPKHAVPPLEIIPKSATVATPKPSVQSPLPGSKSTPTTSGSVKCLAKTQGWSAPRFNRTPTSGGGGGRGGTPGSGKTLTPRLGLSRGFKAVKPLHSKVKLT